MCTRSRHTHTRVHLIADTCLIRAQKCAHGNTLLCAGGLHICVHLSTHTCMCTRNVHLKQTCVLLEHTHVPDKRKHKHTYTRTRNTHTCSSDNKHVFLAHTHMRTTGTVNVGLSGKKTSVRLQHTHVFTWNPYICSLGTITQTCLTRANFCVDL